MNKALIIVDAQIDFCPGGSYPVPDGDKVIQPLNQMISYATANHWKIFASKDWHKEEQFKDKPDKSHCIQNSKGAEYHPDLNLPANIPVISKGANELGDKHYSAFNGDQISLDKLLKQNKISEVYIGGLALDYCVKGTAIDSVKNGYQTFLIKEATKSIKTPAVEVYKELQEKNIQVISLDYFLRL